MVELLDSHEQSEVVKGWLRENGSAIVMGLVLAFGGMFGFKQWQVWEVSKRQQASAEFATMVELLNEDQLDAAMANYDTLRGDFESSAYTALAALHMAKARIEADQPDLAVGLLQRAMESAEPQPLRIIARERLARLKLDLGELEAALALIDGAPTQTGFESRFAEIRGDIQLALGNAELAASEYRRALELQQTGVGFRPLLEMKLEALDSRRTTEAES